MSVMGEAETIVNYPDQIDALVVAAQDPVASNASLAELRIIISPSGWQPELETRLDELGQLAVPTLMIWGENDPLGGADVAQTAAALIPGARLELLAAGHAPWLGHPDRTATLVSDSHVDFGGPDLRGGSLRYPPRPGRGVSVWAIRLLSEISPKFSLAEADR